MLDKEKVTNPSLPLNYETKIVFLDVDGVLNSRTTTDVIDNYIGIEDKKVSLLKDIVQKSGAKIVLISTWKLFWYKEPFLKYRQDNLANYLDEKLARQGLRIVDMTIDEGRNRGEGIIEYLQMLKRYDIEVNKYVILDNEMFDYRKRKLTDKLVKTSDYRGGLCPRHVKKALELLGVN